MVEHLDLEFVEHGGNQYAKLHSEVISAEDRGPFRSLDSKIGPGRSFGVCK